MCAPGFSLLASVLPVQAASARDFLNAGALEAVTRGRDLSLFASVLQAASSFLNGEALGSRAPGTISPQTSFRRLLRFTKRVSGS